ncbi:hypothetical protein DB35_22965 [Streptomyces abyssalis]|uniref:Uncharacterized protein n=1 Tax=Streptomyces abyssalis TaxID=933944 RepID=A0A1E7JP21_9ACTN|nr:hypothetical protein [Streptomyces abyssalis]OEU86576.1 hypothetical protein DB35_22965 [Streptomyces abyssalis]OEU90037.1 hypothetical protein AN215_10555 [Streptomyces abyssalis]OEV30697.1 hypothetical protein AN219_09375 [Streptomyces nanshensis]
MSCADDSPVHGLPGRAPAGEAPAGEWNRIEIHGEVSSVGPSEDHPGLARIELTVPPVAGCPDGTPEESRAALAQWLLAAQAGGLVTLRPGGRRADEAS